MSLHFLELMGMIKEHEGKKILMVDDYTIPKVLLLHKIKETI